jgi:hypothetical protein
MRLPPAGRSSQANAPVPTAPHHQSCSWGATSLRVAKGAMGRVLGAFTVRALGPAERRGRRKAA